MEKFIFIQPSIKFSLLYTTRRFTTLLSKRHHWTMYITKRIKPTQQQPAPSSCVQKIIYPWGLPANILYANFSPRRFRWPRGLRRGSAAALLLGEWVRIPLRAQMFVFYEYCLLPGRVICVGPIPSQVEYYRVYVWPIAIRRNNKPSTPTKH